MNRQEQRLSVALDAVTKLQESLREHRADVKGRAPVDLWLDLAGAVRRGLEDAVAMQPPGVVTKITDQVRKRIAG